ncbi:hypothetical protein BDQ17DRAFT_1367549 [Cyathus striatus]|nr:hypothetical protein BDQ17DRAFT_1367549 [Cyathus striatus]
MPLIPSVKSLSESTRSFKNDKFSLPKGLSSLGKSKSSSSQPAKLPGGSADQVESQAPVTPENAGIMSRFQFEQYTKRMIPTQVPTLSLWKSPSGKDVTDLSELDADEEEIEATKEWSQYSVTQLAQFVPSLNAGLPRLPKISLPTLSLPSFLNPTKEGFEDVYIVLRPINFKHSSKEMLQRIGEVTDMAELQRYLLFQHWGVKVGDHFYHLHIVEEDREDGSGTKRQRLAVSLSEFEHVTLKVPIWQTGKSHEERVMNAISIIRAMGRFKKDDEVEVYGDHSGLKEHILPDEEREKYRRTVANPKRFLPMPFSGEYNAAVNNCVNFSTRYLFYYIFDINPFVTSAEEFRKKMSWVVKKWIVSGCKLDYAKLMDMFTSPMGLLNPMRTLTRTSDGNIFLLRMALVFLGKIQPSGVAPVEGAPSDMNVITENDVKAAAPQVEKEADAEIEKLTKPEEPKES